MEPSLCGKMQTTSPNRRSNKPLVERRRRERINSCLGQMKDLVLQAKDKDISEYSKMEKADILEMTVKYLEAVKRQELTTAASTDPRVMGKYRAGFNECASVVSNYLCSVPSVAPDVKARVLDHLAGCVQRVTTFSQVSEHRYAQTQHHHQQQQQRCQATTTMAPLHVQIPTATSVNSLPGHSAESAFTRTKPQTTSVDALRTPSHTVVSSRCSVVAPARANTYSPPKSSYEPILCIGQQTPMAPISRHSLDDQNEALKSYYNLSPDYSKQIKSTHILRDVENKDFARPRRVWRPW